MTCSIIIPVFNQLPFTEACLSAVFRTLPANVGVEVIVVDNGSTDGTAEFLQRAAAENGLLRIRSVGCNAGFSKACNLGAEAARGDYLLFLNNDTIPLADTRGFEERWPRHLLESDDERFYREDGFSVRSMRDGQVELDENITESDRLVHQALAPGSLSPASPNENALRKALELYPHNVRALHALMTLHRRRGDCEEALRCAEILRRVEPGNLERHLTAVELAFLSGLRERAAQILEYVGRFPHLPQAISERVGLLRGKITELQQLKVGNHR